MTTDARLADSYALTDLFESLGYTPTMLLELRDEEWEAAALLAAAQRRAPMARLTDAVKTLVVHRLSERARLESANPLEGLGTRG